MEQPIDIWRKKQLIRREARARRQQQGDRELLSARIFDRVAGLPVYVSSTAVMCYVSFGSEVTTRDFLLQVRADGKRLAVPCCLGDQLRLFELEKFEELEPGTMGILEPAERLRGLAGRWLEPRDLDLIIVPGLAFDRHGGRIGYGKGYYDRLLVETRPETALVAVAFECQLIDEVPVGKSDVRVDVVVTEKACYHCDWPRRSA